MRKRASQLIAVFAILALQPGASNSALAQSGPTGSLSGVVRDARELVGPWSKSNCHRH